MRIITAKQQELIYEANPRLELRELFCDECERNVSRVARFQIPMGDGRVIVHDLCSTCLHSALDALYEVPTNGSSDNQQVMDHFISPTLPPPKPAKKGRNSR